MAYTQLSLEERNYIEMRLKQADSLNRIARDMNRSQSTISREVGRNTGLRDYRYKQADKKTKQRHAEKPKAIKLRRELVSDINIMLEQQWSPEQISGRLKREGRASICHETNVANQRERLSDWEADTMIGQGHKGVLVTLDERKSKLRLALPVANKTAEAVTCGIITLLGVFKDWVHTFTCDNGKEFARHEEVANTLGCETYFESARLFRRLFCLSQAASADSSSWR